MLNTEQALDQLINEWQQAYGDELPFIEQDPQWPSLCEIAGTEIEGNVRWQPVKREQAGDFSNIEQALELPLHQDIKSYYSLYWSAELTVEHDKGPVSLLQLYNQDDFENLQQNIIGHVMMKRRLKQGVTVFFALTDLDDQIISIKNDNGEVWLEYVGKEPHLKLADSIAAFLALLKIPR
jgi:SecY interacting protein Syd